MEEKGNNVINNYKGVMLCSRPNENVSAPVQKPFCGRVYNHEQIGLVPCRGQRSPQRTQKRQVPTILNKHKKWLHDFQNKQAKAKQYFEGKQKQQQEKFNKIKKIAEKDRERAKKMREEYNQTAQNVMNILDETPVASSRPGQLNAENLRRLDLANERDEVEEKKEDRVFRKKNKKQKPMWALTQQQKQKKEEEEADDLINFFETAQIGQYSEDEQVREILANLKTKINEIKQSENWKQKEAQKIRKIKEERIRRKQQGEDDKYSTFSVRSQAKSVASEKTQQKLEELRKKKQQKQWDKFTTTSKNSYANIEQKIAKNLADEVLRNYPNLRGVHSNTSIRKLLEAQAAKVINEPIPRPVITTVIKEPKPLDTNNLPYLHRNPAI